MRRNLLLIALLGAITPCMTAQSMTAGRTMSSALHFIPLPPDSKSGSLVSSSVGEGPHHRAFRNQGSLVFFADPFYSDALYSSGYPVASQPPVILVQAPQATAPADSSSPPQPLMIELQGTHYVRLSGGDNSAEQFIDQDSATLQTMRASVPATHSPAPHPITPVVLVFRDGHREEVSDYTIAAGVLYARANYYTDGAWNKKIELSSLDLPVTLQSNHSRGVQFQLPSSPNEIIVHP